jgi:hypothetical protein
VAFSASNPTQGRATPQALGAEQGLSHPLLLQNFDRKTPFFGLFFFVLRYFCVIFCS